MYVSRSACAIRRRGSANDLLGARHERVGERALDYLGGALILFCEDEKKERL